MASDSSSKGLASISSKRFNSATLSLSAADPQHLRAVLAAFLPQPLRKPASPRPLLGPGLGARPALAAGLHLLSV